MSQARLWLFEHQTLPLEQRGSHWHAPTEHGGAILTTAELDRLDAEAEFLGTENEGPPLTVSRKGVIHASGRVGVFQAGRLTVELLPKLDRGARDPDVHRARANLLEMLTFSGALPPIAKPGTLQRVEPLDLYETVIGVFSSALLEALREGPRRAYVPTVQNLGVVKGRLVFAEQIRQNLARPDRCVCAFQQLTHDQPLNRVLRYTAWLTRRATRHPSNRWRLDWCNAVLGDVTFLPQTVADCDSLVLDRFSERFEVPLAWARLILASQHPALCAGERPTFALLFDMADVFEAYIARVARKYLGRKYRSIEPKPVIGHLVRHPNGSASVRQIPDLVLWPWTGRPIVVDTKYKVFPGSVQAAEADLRQVYVYQRLLSRGLNGADIGRSVLLYPRSAGDIGPRTFDGWLVDEPEAPGSIRVTVASIGIEREGPALRAVVAAELERLLAWDAQTESPLDTAPQT